MVAACAVASVPPKRVARAAMIVLRIGCLPLVLIGIIGTKSLAVDPNPGGRMGKVSMRRRPVAGARQ